MIAFLAASRRVRQSNLLSMSVAPSWNAAYFATYHKVCKSRVRQTQKRLREIEREGERD